MLISTLVIVISVVAMVEGLISLGRTDDPMLQMGSVLSTVLGLFLLGVGLAWWMGWLGAPPPDIVATLRSRNIID